MSKTPKAFDAAVKMVLSYKPPKDDEESPESEPAPEESEPVVRAVRRGYGGKRRKSVVKNIGRVRVLVRRRRSRKALAR